MADALEVQIKADAASFNKGINEAIAGMNRLVSQGKAAGTKLDGIAKSTQSLASSMKAFGVGILAAIGTQALGALQRLASEFVNLAEAPTKFKSSIEALTGSSSRAEDMLQRVYAISEKTGAGFADTASMVQRLTIGLKALGANNVQIAQIAENIIKLGVVGGSSMADTAAAAMQLTQALASGKLQGDELRSIMERMPKLVEIIAAEMGKSTAEIRKLGSEGKITSDIIAKGLLKATQQINADFEKMPLTVERAMNKVAIAIQRAFDNPAAKAGVQALAQGIALIAVAVQKADIYMRNFASNASNMFKAIGNAIGPVVTKVEQLSGSFGGIGGKIASALSGVANLILQTFLGPIGLIISNWDRLAAYFTNKVPQMFYSMAGGAREGMAAVLSIFSDGFAKLVDIAGRAINAIIDALNFMGSKVNAAFNAFGSAIGIGSTDIIGKIAPIKLEFEGLNNTIVGMQVAAKDNFAMAGQYAQKYATDLRTIARTQAEATSQAEAGSLSFKGLADALNDVNNAASGSGTGGKGGGSKGKGGGGAAGGIKKAGDAAKKAAEDMKSAEAQAKEFGQAMQGIAQSLGSGVVDALFSIADGSKSAKEAFTELAKSMLKQIAQMIMQMLILKPLMGMFGGGFGLLGGGGGGLMGMAARSGPALMGASNNNSIGNYSGFNMSPSAMTSMRSSAMSTGSVQHQTPMNVTINNQSGAQVKTRRDDNTLTVEIIEDIVADRITRGGNKIDSAMQRAFGARRIGY